MPHIRRKRFNWQLSHGRLLLGERTCLMGILNVTPDSFSEQGRYFDRKAAIARGLEIEREGADILDIGGESTRPGAAPVPLQEELDRTIPVIEALRVRTLRIPISIDTYKAAVAESALRAGADIVNDVSGLRFDTEMPQIVRQYHAGVVLMHLRGTPRTMQQMPAFRRVVPAIRRGLLASLQRALHAGIRQQRIVLDPGIGFGKTAEQNYEIIMRLHRLASLGYPLLVGPSRKSFVRRIVAELPAKTSGRRRGSSRSVAELTSKDALVFGTATAVTAAILNGAHIVRVHDVRQMAPVARVADHFLCNAE